MAERIVFMHAAHRSGKEAINGFLSRAAAGQRLKKVPALNDQAQEVH